MDTLVIGLSSATAYRDDNSKKFKLLSSYFFSIFKSMANGHRTDPTKLPEITETSQLTHTEIHYVLLWVSLAAVNFRMHYMILGVLRVSSWEKISNGNGFPNVGRLSQSKKHILTSDMLISNHIPNLKIIVVAKALNNGVFPDGSTETLTRVPPPPPPPD
nr:hypothetical protein HmN_000562600 [Hymenolepis microstoma]